MATLRPDQLDDLVELTYNTHVKRRTWVDISMANQEYIGARLIQGKAGELKSGPKVLFKLQVRNLQSARWTGLYSKDSYDARNLSIGGEEIWSKITGNYTYDVDEPEFQSGDPGELVDEIAMREHGAENNMIEVLESAIWTSPSSSTVDPMPLKGFPYWIQKSATEGFNGGNPSGFSAGCGSVDASTYTKWKSYTFSFAGVTRSDFVSKLIRAIEFTKFKAAHRYAATNNEKPQFELWTVWDVLEALYQYLDARNDNLRDVAGMAGSAKIMGIPIDWCPELTNSGQDGYDSQNPIYGINWSVIKLYRKKGADMRRTGPIPVPGQHDTRAVHRDSWLQMCCTDRRRTFVGYQA